MKRRLSIFLVLIVAFISVPTFLAKTVLKQDKPYEMQKIIKLDKELKVNYHVTRSYNTGNDNFFARTKSSYGYNDLSNRSNSEGRINLYNQLYTLYSNLYNSNDNIDQTESYYVIGQINYNSLGLSSEEARDTYYTFRHDYPIFYFSSNSFVYSDTTMYVLIFEDYKDGSVRQEIQENISTALSTYENLVSEQTGDYNKIKAVHDYLAGEMTYGNTAQNYAHNIVGALIEKVGVCESYARTFELILNYVDIDNILITGMGNNGISTESHAWNLVKLGNYYYWVDVTWDDNSSIVYTYFMKGNSEWAGHTENTPETADFLYSLPNTIANISITYQAIEIFEDDVSIGVVNSTQEAFDTIRNRNKSNSKYRLVYSNSIEAYNVPGGTWPTAQSITLQSNPIELPQGGVIGVKIYPRDNITANSNLTINNVRFTTATIDNTYDLNGHTNFNLNIGNHTVYLMGTVGMIGGLLEESYGSNAAIYNRIGLNIIGTDNSSLVAEDIGNNVGTIMYNGDTLQVGSINASVIELNASEIRANSISGSRLSLREDYDAEINNLTVGILTLVTSPQTNTNATNTRIVNIGNFNSIYSTGLPELYFGDMNNSNISTYPTINITNLNTDFNVKFMTNWMPGEGFKLFNIGSNNINKLNEVTNRVNGINVSIRNHFYKAQNGDVLTCLHEDANYHEQIEAHPATCTVPGNTSGVRCTICGNVISGNEVIPATGHNLQTYTTPATLTSDGETGKRCECGHTENVTTIYRPTTFTLSNTSFIYNENVQHPTVVVRDSQNNVIDSSNYSVTYSDGCREIGTYNVTITFDGNKYSGSKVETFEIIEDPTTYTLLFNSNGGTTYMDSIDGLKGQYTLPACTITPPNYKKFKGWSLSDNGDIITSVLMNQNRVVYAIWEDLPTHTLTYNANGGTGTMNPTSGLIGHYNLPQCTFTPPTYKQFKGWSLTNNGEIIDSIEMDQDKTVYAIWENLPSYLLTFDDNGGTNSMTSIFVPAGEFTLPECTIVPPTGKQFKGWSLTNNGEIITSVTMIQDLTVYPIWEDLQTYTVFFVAEGGIGIMDSVTGLRGTYTLPPNEFYPPAGKQFKGWSLTSNGSIITEVEMNQNREVFAVWEDVQDEPQVPGEVIKPVVSLVSTNNEVILTWGAQTAATKYEVRISTDNKKWTKNEVTTSTYLNNKLTYGKTYYYKVRAYNGVKWSSYSDVVSKKILPAKVNLKISSASTNNVKLSWNKVNVTGYEVWMNGKKVYTATKNSILSFNKTSLKANTTYKFKVRAYKTVSGKKIYGSYSKEISVKTAPVKPSLTVSVKNYKTLNVKLNNVKGATKYRLEMSTDKSKYTLVEELPSSGTLAVSDLTLGKTYYFRVKVCNSSNYCSAYSSVVSKRVTPAKPSFSLSSIQTKQVIVKVNAQDGTTGYVIYRSLKKGSDYKKVATLKNTDEVLEKTDTIVAGKTYYYKVKSYAMSGKTKVYGPYSSYKSIRLK